MRTQILLLISLTLCGLACNNTGSVPTAETPENTTPKEQAIDTLAVLEGFWIEPARPERNFRILGEEIIYANGGVNSLEIVGDFLMEIIRMDVEDPEEFTDYGYKLLKVSSDTLVMDDLGETVTMVRPAEKLPGYFNPEIHRLLKYRDGPAYFILDEPYLRNQLKTQLGDKYDAILEIMGAGKGEVYFETQQYLIIDGSKMVNDTPCEAVIILDALTEIIYAGRTNEKGKVSLLHPEGLEEYPLPMQQWLNALQ